MMPWLIHWFHNTTWLVWSKHNFAPAAFTLIAPFQFSFFLLPATLTLPSSICRRPLTSPSTLAPRFHFSCLLDFICSPVLHLQIRGIHAACTCMTVIKSCDVYRMWTDTWVDPAHTVHAVFFGWRSPSGLKWKKWKSIKSDIFPLFPCILSRLGVCREFSHRAPKAKKATSFTKM